MEKIEFYFDPGCPWCWNASRWIKTVQKSRELDVTWRPFSLLKKNGDDMPAQYREGAIKTHGMLRIIEAAKAKHGDKVVDPLYTQFGILVHHRKATEPEDVLAAIVKVLPDDAEELAKAAEDEQWDKAIADSMQSAFDAVGDDGGVPIIVLHSAGKRLGYFGPLITKAPEGEEALTLWEHFSGLVRYEHFYEVKRTRETGPSLPHLDEGV